MNWVETYNILPLEQAGFRKGCSTTDQLFTFNSIIQNQIIHKKRRLYTVFIDGAAAFDSVNHSLLWQKLDNLQIDPNLIENFQRMYEQASVTVRVNDELSRAIPINCCSSR